MRKDKQKTQPQRHETTAPVHPEDEFALGRQNYVLMAVSFAIIVVGFLLMAGTEDIYSFTKITLAPILVVAGFIFMVYAIMKRQSQ